MNWNRKIEYGVQAFLWLLLLFLTFSFLDSIGQSEQAIFVTLKMVGLLMLAAYLNSWVLIPKLFFKNQFFWYFLLILLLIVFLKSLNYALSQMPIFDLRPTLEYNGNSPGGAARPMPRSYPFLFPPLFISFLGVLFISTIYTLGKAFWKNQMIQQQLMYERTQYELNFLRSQVNPHFLFNALNNLNATIRLHPDRAQNFVLRLSELLRYLLESGKDERINLDQEIQYLEHYVFFQQQKDEAFSNISLLTRGTTDQNIALEPMLFLPLVENAFVHSYRSDPQERFVNIEIRYNAGILCFKVENNLPETTVVSTKSSTGIGLNNVARRLEILYPGNHQFTYGAKNDRFSLQLTISIHAT